MPRNAYSVRSAIASRVDARGYSGAALFSRGATPVSSSTYTGLGEGIFTDILDFLNGRGTPAARTMAASIDSTFTTLGGTPTVEVTITSEDKIRIASTESFSVDAGDNNVYYGINPLGQTAVYDGSTWYEVIAEDDWERGVVNNYKLNYTTAFGTGSSYSGFFQDFPTYINTSGNADSLTDIDVSGYGWLIDDDGYTWMTRRGATAAVTWTSDELRLFLGYTGDESVVTLNGSTYIQSTYPCRSIIVPERPFARQELNVEEESDARRLVGGGWSGVTRGSYLQISFSWYLDGPYDALDLHQHWLRYCLPLLTMGAPVVVYQDWGDSREYGRLPAGGAYSSEQTVELDGYRGRIEGYIVNNDGATAVNWPRQVRRRAPMKLVIEEPTSV